MFGRITNMTFEHDDTLECGVNIKEQAPEYNGFGNIIE